MKKIMAAIKSLMNEYNELKLEYDKNWAYMCHPGRLAYITSC